MELSTRTHDCETSRNGQLHLLAEKPDREHAQQEILICMSEEVEETEGCSFF